MSCRKLHFSTRVFWKRNEVQTVSTQTQSTLFSHVFCECGGKEDFCKISVCSFTNNGFVRCAAESWATLLSHPTVVVVADTAPLLLISHKFAQNSLGRVKNIKVLVLRLKFSLPNWCYWFVKKAVLTCQVGQFLLVVCGLSDLCALPKWASLLFCQILHDNFVHLSCWRRKMSLHNLNKKTWQNDDSVVFLDITAGDKKPDTCGGLGDAFCLSEAKSQTYMEHAKWTGHQCIFFLKLTVLIISMQKRIFSDRPNPKAGSPVCDTRSVELPWLGTWNASETSNASSSWFRSIRATKRDSSHFRKETLLDFDKWHSWWISQKKQWIVFS